MNGAFIDYLNLNKAQLEQKCGVRFCCYFFNRTFHKAQFYAEKFQGIALKSLAESEFVKHQIKAIDALFLGVKPQQLDELDLNFSLDVFNSSAIVSILAGSSRDEIAHRFQTTPGRVVRLMANLSIAKKEGIILSYGDQSFPWIKDLLLEAGQFISLDSEEHIDHLTTYTASMPGILYHLLHFMALKLKEDCAREKISLPCSSELLLLQMLKGATTQAMDQSSSLNFLDLYSKVASKKGVTEAMALYLEENDIDKHLQKMFDRGFEKILQLKK